MPRQVRERTAWEESFPAGADLTGDQYKIVKLNASGQVVLAGSGELAIGVLQNKPNSGEAAQVRIFGLTRMIFAIAGPEPGDRIMSDASGLGVTATGAGILAIGISIGTPTISNEVSAVLLSGPNRNHA